MLYSDFTKRLARGQLKNTNAVADAASGKISPNMEDTILGLVNEGLDTISSKLILFKHTVDLTFVDGQNVYPFQDGTSYLDDTETEDFSADSLVKILDVTREDGRKFTPDTDGHILTPSHNILRFSSDMMKSLGEKVRVTYQAKHPVVAPEDDINLPPNLYTALQLFVASLYLSHMNGPEHTQKGDSYMAAFYRHMDGDEMRDTSSTSEVHEDTRFDDRGFV